MVLMTDLQPDTTSLIAGQGELFDGHDYYQPGTEWPYIPDSMMSDDEVYGLLHRSSDPELSGISGQGVGEADSSWTVGGWVQ